MTPAQMLEHSARAMEMACGKGPQKQMQSMGEADCDGNVHAFFGRMSGAEWAITQYKHLDLPDGAADASTSGLDELSPDEKLEIGTSALPPCPGKAHRGTNSVRHGEYASAVF
jgi:hypothetical protein